MTRECHVRICGGLGGQFPGATRRVQDLDFERRELTVRDGKGNKDRRTMLPLGVGERLRLQLGKVRRLHEKDLAEGYGSVQLPGAL
jgi:integrase